MLLLFRFGWAKPVPVNPYRLKHRIRDERLVSSAGVVVNLTIAWVLSLVLHLLLKLKVWSPESLGTAVLGMGIFTNLILFVFNLAPIPPLDGSRVLRTFLPWDIRSLFDRMDRFGLIIVIIAIQVPGFWGVLIRAMLFLWRYVLLFDEELLFTVLETFTGLIGR